MKFVIDGQTYWAIWNHYAEGSFRCRACGQKITQQKGTDCTILRHDKQFLLVGPDQVPLIARSRCHPDDQYNKEIGRRLSLERAALKLADKILWDRKVLPSVNDIAHFTQGEERKSEQIRIIREVMEQYENRKATRH